MRKHAVILGSLLIFGTAAAAQEAAETPRIDVGLNYSYEHINPGGALSSYNANGGFGYFQYNANNKPVVIALAQKDGVGGTITVNYDAQGEIGNVESSGGRAVGVGVSATFQDLLDLVQRASPVSLRRLYFFY